jgi:hypothetical protein
LLCEPGKEMRMKIKPPITGPSPRVMLKRRHMSPAPISNPFQTWIQPAQVPDGPGEAELPVILQATLPEAAQEQLSSRVMQAVQAAPASVDPHKVLVTFHSGWLQGVTCAVVVADRRVRLRLRADGARQRAELQQSKRIVSARLASAGFGLCGFEVSP